MALSFPLAVIDFEASGLGSESYPIEVGVAIARTPADEVETWSTLIRPHPTWRERGSWERKAQAVHGIAPEMLAEGMEPAAVLSRLNDLLGSIGHAWCDGGGFDQFWFERLCKGAPLVKPAFVLWDVKGLFVLDRRAHNRFAEALAGSEAPHRAGADAVRICRAITFSRRRIKSAT